MKKLFLILGVIGGLSVMDSYALKPGDVMKTGDNEWWACPPDCSFRQLSDGSWTCMDHDVECPGIKGGIRSYDHYPTDYVVNDENAQTGVMIKDASVVGSKKLDKTSVSRAARTTKTANTSTSRSSAHSRRASTTSCWTTTWPCTSQPSSISNTTCPTARTSSKRPRKTGRARLPRLPAIGSR